MFARLLLLIAGLGCILHVVALFRLRRFLSKSVNHTNNRSPLTLWRTVKPGQADVGEKLEALLAASAADDQILVGVDAGSAEFEICRAWQAEHSSREITVVPCVPGRAANPKISKFLQMEPFAKRGEWLLTDSEALLTREFVDRIREEWATSGADALTAGYRFVGMHSSLELVDTLPAAVTLWPGLMLVGRVDFTLGACTAVRAADVASIEGWSALEDELAEDYQLGHRLTRSGKRIRLHGAVLNLQSDALTLTDYLRHQHRVAVTYRTANPWGALGLPVLHATPAAMLATLLEPGIATTALAIFAARGVLAILGAHRMGMARGTGWIWAPFVPVLEGIFWLVAWLPLPVWWAGKWRRISWGGQFAGEESGTPKVTAP